ncbi:MULTISPECIES: SLC13 family permease [Kosmotoga]|uniref:Citrate transporter n=1 Tax=Kosmotoga olearia (strain ATCC BAA-1733 / DSM 21960 / TBF 19.5.1) TaxID=521045 RepID=C5CGL0_KOSOT|nr:MULTISPECIES: ArsB/NhaD family transporter [Kosmotoga]ACR79592.1 Citrate transporter [Kosmotoga olearia TBF 19.5.1]MDI3523842.1 hypothetical protein [Kosmotoga sp.]
MSYQTVVAVSIFLISYFFLITERLNRMLVALFGATFMLIFGVFRDPAIVYKEYVDFNTIFLLIGMMIFVAVMKKSGIFEYFGALALKLSKGSMVKLYLYMVSVVALASSILDNVTTILVFVPITLAIADAVGLDPFPLVLGEIFSSNIGGALTLIGDPPNIMIGSAAGLSFMDFIVNLGPAIVLIFIATHTMIIFLLRKKLSVDLTDAKGIELTKAVTNRKNFRISIVLLVITTFLFLFQHELHLESSTIALLMAALSLTIMDRKNVEATLEEVEWSTILFFIGLFVVVGGLEETGVLENFAHLLIKLSRGSYHRTMLFITNASAVISAFIDNIPYTATMIPVVESMKKINPETFSNLNPLWWSLSLGACLGGNGTPIGASANIIGLAVLKKYYGKEISFVKFMAYGMLVVLVSMIISSVYLMVRY